MSDEAVRVVIGIVSTGAAVGLVLVHAIDRRLREEHTTAWKALGLGRARSWCPPPASAQLRFLRFLSKREEESLKDAYLNRLCRAFRWYYTAYVLFIVSTGVLYAAHVAGNNL